MYFYPLVAQKTTARKAKHKFKEAINKSVLSISVVTPNMFKPIVDEKYIVNEKDSNN
jgi:hypothetical protein